MLCSTKLSSNKNAKSNLTLTPDNLDYIYHFIGKKKLHFHPDKPVSIVIAHSSGFKSPEE